MDKKQEEIIKRANVQAKKRAKEAREDLIRRGLITPAEEQRRGAEYDPLDWDGGPTGVDVRSDTD